MELALAISLLLLIIIFTSMVSRVPEEQKKNLEDTQKYCEENQYKFIRNKQLEELPEDLQKFTMFQRHIGHKDFHSIVEGNNNDFDFSLMTFVYPGNSGNYGRLVCIIKNKDCSYPDFYLRETRMLTDTVGKLLGKQDINTTEDKVFSEKFLLQSNNPNAILEYFNQKRRDTILKEHVNGYEYEANSEYFVISYPYKDSIPVAEYKALLTKTISLLKKLEA